MLPGCWKEQGGAVSTQVTNADGTEVDLIERDLAWKKDVRAERIFAETIREIKECL